MEKKEEEKAKNTCPLKDVLDKNFNYNQNNEFKHFILPKTTEKGADPTFEQQMNSITNALCEEVELEDAIKQAVCLEENLIFKDRTKIEKEGQIMINEAIETCFRSCYEMISDEFQKKLQENIKNKQYSEAFKLFGEKPKAVYKPDNDFIRYLCLGLINMDDIKELNLE